MTQPGARSIHRLRTSIFVIAALLPLAFLLWGDVLERGATHLGPEVVLEEESLVVAPPDLAPVTQTVVREEEVGPAPEAVHGGSAIAEPVAAAPVAGAAGDLAFEDLAFEGLAVARQTGLAMAGVEVLAVAGGRRGDPLGGEVLATTDSAGRFSVPATPDEATRWVAMCAEFIGPRLVELHARNAERPQRIELEAPARLFGTIAGLLEPAQVVVQTDAYQLGDGSMSGTIFMFEAPKWTAAVSASGTFELEGLPPGPRLSVSVRSIRTKIAALTVAEPITLAPGESRQVAWEVGAGPSILGRVVGSDGAPISDVEVGLYAASVGRVGLVENYWTATSIRRSGPDGGFEFQDVQPGQWFIGPKPRGRKDSGDPVYVPVSRSVEVIEGGGNVQVTIVLEHGLFVRGTVLKGDEPLASALVVAHMVKAQFHESGQADRAGAFSIGPMPAGDVVLSTMSVPSRGEPSLIAQSPEVTVPAGTDGVTLRVREGCAMTLIATDAETDQAVPAKFTLTSDELLTLSMEYQESQDFDGLLPGTFTARAETRDGRAGILEGFMVKAGEHADDVRIPLEAAGTVRVRFESGAGVLGASLLRGDRRLGSTGLHSGGDTKWLAPTGEYTVELVLRDFTQAEVTEVRREEHRVSVRAGETADVLFVP